jgi:integrase/recombinase XerD
MPTKLHSLFSSYLSHLERKGDKDETVKRNRHALARHDAWLSDLWIEPPKVTELVVEEYFAWLDGVVEQTTANREAGMVRGAYRYAVRIGMIDKDPAEYVKAPSVEEAEPDVYTNEELRRIRAALRTDLEEVIFYGFAYTGLRRCELCKLKPEAPADIDRGGNRVTTSISSVRRSR